MNRDRDQDGRLLPKHPLDRVKRPRKGPPVPYGLICQRDGQNRFLPKEKRP